MAGGGGGGSRQGPRSSTGGAPKKRMCGRALGEDKEAESSGRL